MSFFIKKIAKNIFDNNKELKNLILVLPNNRLVSIIKSELKNLLFKNNSIWIPNIYTIEEFMEEVSEVFLIDNFSLLLYFYKIFNNNSHYNQSFKEFYQWAPQVLSDFDELDINLINIKDFFSHMISYDDINKWNPNNFFEKKININKKHTSIWQILFDSYYQLRNKLLKKKHAYSGLIFRIAAKNINKYILKNNYLKKIIFIGLNDLSKSELKIIEHLYLLNKLEIYWDIDKYYYEDENKEAGLLFRYYFNNYSFLKEKIINLISDEYKNNKKIEVIQTIGKYNQLKIIEKLLIDLTNQNKGLSKTVIALPNEYMTIPILNSFYKELKELNIELTCFLNSLSLSQSYLLLFRLFCNREKSKIDNFYKKDILDLFINIHFNTLLKCKNTIPNFLIQNNDSYISDTILYNFFKKKNIINIFNPLNKNIKNFLLMLKYSSFLFRINIFKKNNDNFFELTFLNYFDKWINGIQSIINKNNNSINNIESLLSIYKYWLKLDKAKFFNETNSNLYLMGIIETNLMDFDNVIIITVNEGILPPEKYKISWIPIDIRKIFKLSNYQKEDSLYAYYFYHIIQRAKKIFLIYDNNTKLYPYGEKSRFIYQLNYELPHKITNKTFNIFPLFINAKKEVPIKICKNFSILKKIEYLIYKKGISPSSINLYIKNPIEFYLRKILNINNNKIKKEPFDYQKIGIIVHNIIYDLYRPFINKILTIKIIEILKKSLNIIAKKKFQELKLNFNNGKNLLEFVIVKNYVEKIISWDEKNILLGNKIIIKNIEYNISSSLGANFKNIKLCGIIDRVDDFNGSLRIIDYKSGIIKEKNLDISSSDFKKVIEDSKFDTTLQLLIYIIIWFFYNKNTNIIYAGIFSFKNKKQDIISLFIDKKNAISLDKIKNFLPILLYKILELINPKKSFIEKK